MIYTLDIIQSKLTCGYIVRRFIVNSERDVFSVELLSWDEV